VAVGVLVLITSHARRTGDARTEAEAKEELLSFIAKASDVRLEDDLIEDPSVLLNALRTVRHVPAHHSFPGERVRVSIRTATEYMLVTIARDSESRSEFWVWLPGSDWRRDPFGRFAGRLSSGELDRLLTARGL
jgi:hypothetical protein